MAKVRCLRENEMEKLREEYLKSPANGGVNLLVARLIVTLDRLAEEYEQAMKEASARGPYYEQIERIGEGLLSVREQILRQKIVALLEGEALVGQYREQVVAAVAKAFDDFAAACKVEVASARTRAEP